jgi:hypothetical protein
MTQGFWPPVLRFFLRYTYKKQKIKAIMNKIFIIVLLCLATMAQAQAEKGKWTFIPMAGANLIVSEPLDYEIGVTAGVRVDWQATDKVAVSSGVFYSLERYRMNTLTANNDLCINTGRMEIPLLANVYVYKNLALKAGIQANLRLHSGVRDQEESWSAYNLVLTKSFENTGDAMHVFYFSVPVGISYEFNRFVIDLRYIFGLQNLRLSYKSKNSFSSGQTTTFYGGYISDKKVNKLQFTIGYRL